MRAGKVVKGLGMAAVALTLVSACMVGSTLAKYSSEVTGTGSAVVAKWALKAGDTDGGTAISSFTLNGTSSSTGVVDGKIAPGTNGSIPIYYDLTGTEVATKVTIEVKVDDVEKLPANFKMKKSDNTFISKADMTSDTYILLYTADIKKDQTGTVGQGKSSTQLEWKWDIGDGEATNTLDTTAGEGFATANFTVRVQATQLENDPTNPAA